MKYKFNLLILALFSIASASNIMCMDTAPFRIGTSRDELKQFLTARIQSLKSLEYNTQPQFDSLERLNQIRENTFSFDDDQLDDLYYKYEELTKASVRKSYTNAAWLSTIPEDKQELYRKWAYNLLSTDLE